MVISPCVEALRHSVHIGDDVAHRGWHAWARCHHSRQVERVHRRELHPLPRASAAHRSRYVHRSGSELPPTKPATKRPPRIPPRASILRYTYSSSRHVGASDSRITRSRQTIP